nr:N-acetylmuramoyl-L-alanine amidase [Actinomycetota bacterium]
AHAGDYNVDSTGISLIGSFETTTPTLAMKGGLVNLIAWRLGTAYRGAYGGAVVEGKHFARIAGHRDAMSTACPGQRVYDWLPRLRERVGQRLGDYQSMIEQLWLSRGGAKGFLGPVRVGERKEHRGRHTTFQDGRIYSSASGQFVLRPGPILKRYLKAGETASHLGYPASGVRSPRDGYAADFQAGALLWSPATGSVFLPRSAVLKRYRAEHGAFGQLGFPTTRVRTSGDSAVVYLQNGTITFDKTTKRIKVTYE